MYFVALLQFKFTQLIVQFNNHQRLHEYRGSGAGLVVDDRLQLTFEFSPQRNDIATIPLCDNALLKHGRRAGITDDAL